LSTPGTKDQDVAGSIERFTNVANGMTKHDLGLCIKQAEAIVAAKTRLWRVPPARIVNHYLGSNGVFGVSPSDVGT
jgi:hypothetical protein